MRLQCLPRVDNRLLKVLLFFKYIMRCYFRWTQVVTVCILTSSMAGS